MKSGLRRRLLQFAFRLLYNEFALVYDTVSRLVSLGQWRCWQRSVLPHLENTDSGLVLELAHGTGALQVDLQRADYPTVAFDLSVGMGRIARKRLSRARLSTDFVRGDALSLPFGSSTFAAIVSTFPTSFIFDKSCLAEIHRVLHLDGRVIIVMSAGLKGPGLRRAFIRFMVRITGQSSGATSLAAYADAFAGFGFTVEPKEVDFVDSVAQLLVLQKR